MVYRTEEDKAKDAYDFIKYWGLILYFPYLLSIPPHPYLIHKLKEVRVAVLCVGLLSVQAGSPSEQYYEL